MKGDGLPSMFADGPGRPLDGTTVVSLEQAVAAPLATRHMADLGARVIKIERLDGDFARAYDQAVRGMASHFVWLNRGKESVALDLKSERGRKVLTELVARADVFLQNLAPGAAARLGFGETLRETRPELVVVNLSGYGPSGPYRDKRAYDMLVQAEAGVISVTGWPEQPAKAGIPISDIATGMYAFSGVLAALLRRANTGVGATIDVSLFDATAEWMSHPMYTAAHTGEPPPRAGLSHPAVAPYDAYPTADDVDVLIGIQNDRGWVRLANEVLERPDLADHPDYATNIARVRNRSEVDKIVAAGTRRMSVEDLISRLDAAGIASARLNSVSDVLTHPQLSERDRWRVVDTPVGKVDAILPPITFDDVEARMDAVPALGEHTDAVLSELGYPAERIAELRSAGVVG